MSNKKYQRIPAAPFVEWLNEQLRLANRERDAFDGIFNKSQEGLAVGESLARLLGFSERTMRRYAGSMDGENVPVDNFARDPVENALDRMSPGLFGQVYPEIVAADTDPPLEPAIFCRQCREIVTPINGLCPWCTPESEHPFSCPDCGGWKRDRKSKRCVPCTNEMRKAAA